ncbi:MAG: hypothetical protein IPL10_03560 [Bacteroidetes bacterium]|nr:hypothetical protein [Bacteroidota bacterium]
MRKTSHYFLQPIGLKSNLKKIQVISQIVLKAFLTSSNNYLILDEEDPYYDNIFEHTMKLVEGNKNDIHINELKDQTYLVLTKFINKLNTEIISENHFGLNDTDRKNIQQAEAFLLNNLMSSFPGIEKLHKEVGISPSKLKWILKLITIKVFTSIIANIKCS